VRYVAAESAEYDELMATAPGLDCSGDEDKTLQQFKDDCDINVIVRRIALSGASPAPPLTEAVFGDFTSIDFHTALEVVRAGKEAFMSLPGEVREAFANDPAVFVEALQDPERRDELVKLGVLEPLVGAPVVDPGKDKVEKADASG